MIKMFAGLMRLECQGNYNDNGRARHHHCAQAIMEGGSASTESAGRKRLHRRPGYMRTELPRPQSASAGEEGNTACLISGAPDGRLDLTPEPADTSTAKVLLVNQWRSDKPDSVHCQQSRRLLSSSPAPPQEGCGGVRCPPGPQGDLRLTPGSAFKPHPAESSPSASSGDTFSSSFSFIQQSLTSGQGMHTAAHCCPLLEPPPLDQSSPKTLPCGPGFVLSAPSGPESASPCHSASKTSGGGILGQPAAVPVRSDLGPAPAGQSELSLGERLWQDRHWEGREGEGGRASVTSDLRESLPDSDSCSLDAEAASSLSVDSDAGSASSVTSGYDSATPTCERSRGCWDRVAKTYQGVLQDCLHNNRTNNKIESMMLKLQRLQQKAILDDDYDTAERFGKKLDELRVERSSLRLGLPSRHPRVAGFLQRLTEAVHSALRRAELNCRVDPEVDGAGEGADSARPRLQRRDCLVQEKCLVEEEMRQLQVRLEELQERRHSLEQQLLQEEQGQEQQAEEEEEAEGSALRSCSPAQLRDLSRTLEDLLPCQSRTQMCVSPPPSLLRLQEQNQALSLSIRETTAKVVMSQRLGASLRRKVSETETQLLALHEAKLAAIAGNDFSSAKELKVEIRTACVERDRLEGLAARLQRLSAGNSQDLARTKQQQQRLRLELAQGEALHERSLKENAAKYIELLEDRLHSCGCPALERVWEADLEACHLFLRGLKLGTPSLGGPDVEDPPAPVVQSHSQPCTKEEEDCAMLTALGGRWCPEANLQNSEFTKKLEEFLFCMEEHHPEEECGEAADLTERCELISDRLMTLEDDLQTAIMNRDQALTQALEKQVGEVKAALQTMLAQLKEDEEEEEEHREEDKDENEIEEQEEEEDEDQYFSDSWEI